LCDSQAQSGYALDAYARYLASERRAKTPDVLIMSTVHERAIAEAAKRRFNGEVGAEEALRAFWVGYSDSLVRHINHDHPCVDGCLILQQRISGAEEDVQLAVLKRAIRSVPGSGEVWARYIRFLVSLCSSRYLLFSSRPCLGGE
jgi:hypothetical protein